MKRALVFSALGWNTGCALRARYLRDALARLGWDARLALPPFPSLPLSLECLLSAPYFAWLALFSRAELAVGIKPYPNCWLALWILRLKGARAVADVDDLDFAWRGGPLGLAARLSQAPAFAMLGEFSTHHPGIRERLDARGLKVHALEQGVDLTVFKARKAASRRKRLLFCAHLNVACQLDALMERVAPVLARHPDWELLVAGGGPKLGAYRARYEGPQVRFSGQLSPEAVAGEIAQAALCLSAYAAGEGNAFRVPMKVGEYLAMGRPVATDLIPGLKPLASFVYPLSRIGALMRGQGDGRERRGAAWVRARLSWDKVAARFLKDLG